MTEAKTSPVRGLPAGSGAEIPHVSGNPSGAEIPHLRRWEYRTEVLAAHGWETDEGQGEYRELLADLGADGWELVTATSHPAATFKGWLCVLLFKRPAA